MIKFQCPHCQRVLKVEDRFAGKSCPCPGCAKPITIPAQSTPLAGGDGAALPAPTAARSAAPTGQPKAPPTKPSPPKPPAPLPGASPPQKSSAGSPAAGKPPAPPPGKSTPNPPPAPKPTPPAAKPAGIPPAVKAPPKSVSPPPGANPGTPPPKPEDLEALAAAELTREEVRPQQPGAEPKDPGVVEFRCSYCDEQVQVSAALGGKQAPCPSCRRIVKIPLPTKTGPKDWRTAGKDRPAAAKQQVDPSMTDAWSTAAATRVGQDVLEEADAIPDVREPLTRLQLVGRGLTGLAVVVAVAGAVWFVNKEVKVGQQSNTIDHVVKATDKAGLAKVTPPGAAAELLRGLGEFSLRNGRAEKARKQLAEARGLLNRPDVAPLDHDWLAIDIALTQADLGGDKPEVDADARIPREKMYEELLRTMQTIKLPETRAEGMRLVARKLLPRGKDPHKVLILAARLGYDADAVEVRAVAAREVFRAGHRDLAEAEGRKLLDVDPGERGTAPALIVLWLQLNKEVPPGALGAVPTRPDDRQPDTLARPGWVEGWARTGHLEDARTLAMSTAAPVRRLAALVALAGAAADATQDKAEAAEKTGAAEAAPILGDVLTILENDPARTLPPALLLQIVRLGARTGLSDRVRPLVERIADPSYRGRAYLELFRERLSGPPDKVGKIEDAQLEPIKTSSLLSHALAREILARYLVRTGTGSARTVAGWPESVQPIGYLGAALALLDTQ